MLGIVQDKKRQVKSTEIHFFCINAISCPKMMTMQVNLSNQNVVFGAPYIDALMLVQWKFVKVMALSHIVPKNIKIQHYLHHNTLKHTLFYFRGVTIKVARA